MQSRCRGGGHGSYASLLVPFSRTYLRCVTDTVELDSRIRTVSEFYTKRYGGPHVVGVNVCSVLLGEELHQRADTILFDINY